MDSDAVFLGVLGTIVITPGGLSPCLGRAHAICVEPGAAFRSSEPKGTMYLEENSAWVTTSWASEMGFLSMRRPDMAVWCRTSGGGSSPAHPADLFQGSERDPVICSGASDRV